MADKNATATTTETAPGNAAGTTTVRALVTLTVVPQEGQTPEAAADEMFLLFQEHLTNREGTFLTDYGITQGALTRFRAGELEDTPTWGGYEGPYVLDSRVANVSTAAAVA